MHQQRSLYDAIMVGTGTVISDNPELTTRLWYGRNPKPITFDLHGNLPKNSKLASNKETIIISNNSDLKSLLTELYTIHGITSLIVEGGCKLLNSFISENLFNEIRMEISPILLHQGVPAPQVNCYNFIIHEVRNNKIIYKKS